MTSHFRTLSARDVTAAMLVVKNENISLLWELSIFMYVHVNSSRKNSVVLTPNMAALSRGANQELVRSHGTITRDTFTRGNAYYRGVCHCSYHSRFQWYQSISTLIK